MKIFRLFTACIFCWYFFEGIPAWALSLNTGMFSIGGFLGDRLPAPDPAAMPDSFLLSPQSSAPPKPAKWMQSLEDEMRAYRAMATSS